MELDQSFAGQLLSALLGQLPSLVVELGFAIALLVMLLPHRATLGRARMPALAGAALLVGLALLTRLVFAGLQAYAMAGGTPALGISAMYAVVGTLLQVLHGVAIILLGLAIIRR